MLGQAVNAARRGGSIRVLFWKRDRSRAMGRILKAAKGHQRVDALQEVPVLVAERP